MYVAEVFGSGGGAWNVHGPSGGVCGGVSPADLLGTVGFLESAVVRSSFVKKNRRNSFA